MRKTAYTSKTKKCEIGTANVPLFDDDGNVLNMVSTVREDSILFYDEKTKTGFSDIAGQKVKMICKIDTIDGIKTTTDIVTVINKLPNKVTVLINDEYRNVSSKIVNFVKIKDGE